MTHILAVMFKGRTKEDPVGYYSQLTNLMTGWREGVEAEERQKKNKNIGLTLEWGRLDT
jgi:hypothetical protein